MSTKTLKFTGMGKQLIKNKETAVNNLFQLKLMNTSFKHLSSFYNLNSDNAIL